MPKPSEPQRVVLLAIPLFHVTGCLSWLMRAFFSGSKMVMLPKWSVDEAVSLIKTQGVTVIGGQVRPSYLRNTTLMIWEAYLLSCPRFWKAQTWTETDHSRLCFMVELRPVRSLQLRSRLAGRALDCACHTSRRKRFRAADCSQGPRVRTDRDQRICVLSRWTRLC